MNNALYVYGITKQAAPDGSGAIPPHSPPIPPNLGPNPRYWPQHDSSGDEDISGQIHQTDPNNAFPLWINEGRGFRLAPPADINTPSGAPRSNERLDPRLHKIFGGDSYTRGGVGFYPSALKRYNPSTGKFEKRGPQHEGKTLYDSSYLDSRARGLQIEPQKVHNLSGGTSRGALKRLSAKYSLEKPKSEYDEETGRYLGMSPQKPVFFKPAPRAPGDPHKIDLVDPLWEMHKEEYKKLTHLDPNTGKRYYSGYDGGGLALQDQPAVMDKKPTLRALTNMWAGMPGKSRPAWSEFNKGDNYKKYFTNPRPAPPPPSPPPSPSSTFTPIAPAPPPPPLNPPRH